MADRSRGRGGGNNRGRGGNRGGNSRGGNHRTDGQFRTPVNGDNDGEYNAHLSERFKGVSRQSHGNRASTSDNSKFHLPLNPDVARYIQKQDAIPLAAEPGDWTAIPEIPPPSEILIDEGEAVKLPSNKIDQPWSKKERYLKTHYKLLREDAISPLREAVAKFRKDPHRMDDHDTRIYEQVRVVGLTFTYKGICSRIRFSTARSQRKISWRASKRLTSGTLVALTPTQDGFKSQCILATVAARPIENLESVDNLPPEIDILFAEHEAQEVDPQRSYIMIEASQGYYEAYRHTLRALQKQSKESFPLAEHICQLRTDVDPPDYLQQNPFCNITPAADEKTFEAYKSVNLIDDWPSTPSTTLDTTQWAAMRDILTRKLAIIQGPPGTGKTHVSKIAIDILLQNRQPNDPPIIVACQTNHALDQLLTFINEFESKFIRLGGRSSTPLVKARALHEVRKAQVYDDIPGSCLSKARRDINTETLKLKSLLSPVRADAPSPITAEHLFHLGVITAQQQASLNKEAENWVRADEKKQEPLDLWLGRAVTPFVATYSKDSFSFEEAEEDLEAEQLKELEAELGVTDEEDTELLKGEYLPLSFGLTMPQPSQQTIEQAKRALDTQSNLYKVPEHLKGAVYMIMQEKTLSIVSRRLREGARDYSKLSSLILVGRWEKDVAYLAQGPIIGMTTTGLSKYRGLVSALKPKIILIEEAAEVLEAPIGVACVDSLQHLILVGDHQQLQAHCSVKELEGEPYYLNISMFERLVRNKMPHRTLLRQRRMEPEFRELIQPFYPKLKDHESIVTRPRTEWGMGEVISWFFNHDYQELQDESMSTFNTFEAEMIAKFYRHLIRNRVPPAAITVLTFYNGQRKKILRALKDDPETCSLYNKVKTVDSYQGEENHIVILSLVRNNISGKIGFLDINNRIVVALSRAKYGFYIFGNGEFLSEHNEVWAFVEELMFKQGRSQKQMPLTCTAHHNQVWVKHPEDFDRLNGGCLEPCGGSLSCGHRCPMRCHPMPHEWLTCATKCNKELMCGHFCVKKCSEPCSCACPTFQEHTDTSMVEKLDNTPQWRALAAGQLTEENVSKLPSGSAEGRSLPQSNEPTDPRPVIEQTMKQLPNGRTRYEQPYSSRSPDAPAKAMSKLIIQESQPESRQSIKEGKKPAHQPVQRAPRHGFDGTSDNPDTKQKRASASVSASASTTEQVNVNKPAAPKSLISWDTEPAAPEKNVDMSQWINPVSAEEAEWEEQMKKAREAEDFW